jgi:hypothetical protein
MYNYDKDFLNVGNSSAVIRSTYERRSLETSYLVEGLELYIRKVAYTKYDATVLVRWSTISLQEILP